MDMHPAPTSQRPTSKTRYWVLLTLATLMAAAAIWSAYRDIIAPARPSQTPLPDVERRATRPAHDR